MYPRFAQAADIVAHRIKAVERVAVHGDRWEDAQYMEFLTPDNFDIVATFADLQTIITEKRVRERLMPSNSGNYWKGKGKGGFGRRFNF